MQNLAAIEAVYNGIDGEFEREREDARTAGEITAIHKVEAKQRINDQAYFILCWGQLETAIDDKCRHAIRRGKENSSWAIRRAWDLYNPDDRRLSGLSFEDRVSLVLDRDDASWNTAIRYYNLRNQIAHGQLQADRIDVPKVVADFYIIQSSMRG
jgi:hypothetical protein